MEAMSHRGFRHGHATGRRHPDYHLGMKITLGGLATACLFTGNWFAAAVLGIAFDIYRRRHPRQKG